MPLPVIPLIVASFWGALLSIAGTLVAQVLLSLGIGYVTFTGVNTAITWARDLFLSGMTGLPVAAIGLATTMKLGVCVSMVLSAITARMVLSGLSAGGAIKKMVVK